MLKLRHATVFMPAFAFVLLAAPRALGENEKELLKTKAKVAFLTPDGKILVAASKDNVRLVYLDIKKSRLLHKEYQPTYLSPDGKVLATIKYGPGDDSAASLIDVATAKTKGQVQLPPSASVAFCVAPGGKACAYGTLKDLVIVDAATGKATHTFKDAGGQPWTAAFSPDGKLLACGSGSQKYQVVVWSMAALKPVHTWEMPNVTQAVAFAQDSKLLAASSEDVVRVWNLATGKMVHAFSGPKDKLMRGLAFGNNSKVLASANADGLVRIWDMTTGQASGTINIGVAALRVTMSDNGKVLAVTGEDEYARVYDVSAVGRK
jgi:WD40 repeat protein